MPEKYYTVEELMLDEGFIDYCLHEDSAYKPYWQRIIELNKEQHAIFKEAADNIRLLSGNLSREEIEIQIAKVTSQLHNDNNIPAKIYEQTDSEQPTFLNPKKKFKKITLSLVSLSLVICVSIFFFLRSNKTPLKNNESSDVAYKSKPGERMKILLPDSSTAILNGNSTITIASDFNMHSREVKLSGDAFFKVAKNAEKPFIVKSSDFAVTAVGTEFYVHAQNPHKDYKVDLLEGKVKLDNKDNQVYLMPGEEAAKNTQNSKLTIVSFDTSALKNWVTGTLSFKDTPIELAIQQLSEWYGIDIDLESEKNSKAKISGTYNDAPLDDVLKVVCFTLSCKYRYVDNHIVIE